MLQKTDKNLNKYASQDVESIFKELESSKAGLSNTEVGLRLQKFGKNILAEEKKSHWVLKYLSQFKNPLILILLFATVFSFILGEEIETYIIGGIILVSTFLNFIQEHKASKAAEELEARLQSKATVMREGKNVEVNFKKIVIGDVIFLNAGDLIPADARVIEAKDFFVNQSSLTGESYPSEKTAMALAGENFALGDLKNIVFLGSNVVSGSAMAVILKTGKDTEFGKIAKDLAAPEVESEFVKGVNKFSFFILKTTIAFVVFIFFFNSVFKHNSVFESFMFAIAVAVGLTPELLPMILSITMGSGSIKMSQKGVIVKKLSAIPNFGSMDILCTDKTGTLTQDRIELVKYVDCQGKDNQDVLLHAYLNSCYQTSITNPMDNAVLKYQKIDIKDYKKIDEIPFDFVRKKMSVVVEKDGNRFIITKGAPEEVMKSSTLEIQDHSAILKVYENLSAQGHRVLAIAQKEVGNGRDIYEAGDEKELTMLGFIAFFDPAKKEAKEIIREINQKGVQIKIITGDNELVTKKICQELDIEIKGVMLGQEIDTMTDDALRIMVEKTTIFARFSPDEKNRIILALKANGHVVGYMGDGINDAPSLKTADVGISVENAVNVAKESAEIILTHKSLRELLDGIIEGRKTFGNSMKYLMMGISSNFGNMFSVLGAVILLPFLPMLPIQILLNNLLYDISQISIPKDNVDEEYVATPKRWNMRFIKRFMIVFGLVSSIFDFATFGFLYYFMKVDEASFQTGWFLESMATQVLIIHFIRTRKLPFIQSNAHPALVASTLGMVLLAWIIPFTPVAGYLGFVPLNVNILLGLGAIILAYLATVEIAKRVFYRKMSY
ncbi:magnesium-translocating P-type ATPase [Candidatus Peregrinibacteria bacterium]|nr:magnesium-translocating P-type ATPase [Candidatus Peregrinibacteria bacterium]